MCSGDGQSLLSHVCSFQETFSLFLFVYISRDLLYSLLIQRDISCLVYIGDDSCKIMYTDFGCIKQTTYNPFFLVSLDIFISRTLS